MAIKKIPSTNKTFDMTPGTDLIETISHAGYTLESAIADIVDNSITAKSRNIDIRFNWDEDFDNCYVEIVDDGIGMTSNELQNAMVLSKEGMKAKRKVDDLGKFGLGMKTASLSQCNVLTVISKKANSKITAKRIDQVYVSTKNKWIGLDLDGTTELNVYHLKQGTIVRWDDLNFVINGENGKRYFYESIDKVKRHLEMCFHRFLISEQVKITINGNKDNPLKGWNPEFCHEGTKTLGSKKIQFKNEIIHLKSIQLPASSQVSEEQEKEMYRDNNALNYQGFFVYRNNRMLIAGGWLGLKGLNEHQKFNPIRIIVDIPSKLDEDFKVDFTKATLVFPQDVQQELIKFAKQARNSLKRQTGHSPLRGNGTVPVWIQRDKKDGVELSINMDHPLINELCRGIEKKEFKKLIKLLSSSVPQIPVKLISHYSDEELIELMNQYYANQKVQMKSNDEIRMEMNMLQPFSDYPDVLRSFFEEEIKK